ncbi:c-type cytochrome [Sulfurospirillum sp. T05]|uniref:C-type cytochrome n=1 Tax=Sulfurospirillum tamanense TaxID=2813362 RepID=A0ABS2WSM2_9BACT|nr:c-type cytochrome [Sulfurospirillum tamanensis]MBN2964668.1 c-type cytochrome [Sulfurospirillum tamanensis]
MKKVLFALLVVGVSSLVAADGAAVYKKCISCHGASAEKKALGKSEVIAGWAADKQIAALKGYKDGTYGGPMKNLMKGQVANLSDAEIEAVSKYVESLAK